MFRDTRRQKLRNRVILAAAGVAVMTFGIWLNYQDDEKENISEDPAKAAVVQEKTERKEEKKKEQKENDTSNQSDAETENKTDTINVPETYLIKEVEGVVKVFTCDEDGNKELYLITSIPFDLLSESDQQLFRDGVELETEEDLGKFLENFDS